MQFTMVKIQAIKVCAIEIFCILDEYALIHIWLIAIVSVCV